MSLFPEIGAESECSDQGHLATPGYQKKNMLECPVFVCKKAMVKPETTQKPINKYMDK